MKEKEENVIELDLPCDILEICIKFMHYKTVNRRIEFKAPSNKPPPFNIEPSESLKVLKAAIYL